MPDISRIYWTTQTRATIVAENTSFPHKKSRCTTWYCPNSELHNQIDYILTPQRFKSSIIRTSTRTYPSEDINSDHDLVLCNMKYRKINQQIRKDMNTAKEQWI